MHVCNLAQNIEDGEIIDKKRKKSFGRKTHFSPEQFRYNRHPIGLTWACELRVETMVPGDCSGWIVPVTAFPLDYRLAPILSAQSFQPHGSALR